MFIFWEDTYDEMDIGEKNTHQYTITWNSCNALERFIFQGGNGQKQDHLKEKINRYHFHFPVFFFLESSRFADNFIWERHRLSS